MLPFILISIIVIFAFTNVDVGDIDGYELLTYNRADYKVSPTDIQKKAQEADTTTVGLDGTLNIGDINNIDSSNLGVADNAKNYWSLVVKYSNNAGVDPVRVAALITVESNWQPDVTSSGGARGLMQMIDSTFSSSGVNGNYYDPETNIHAGTIVFKSMLNDAINWYGSDDSTNTQSAVYYYANRIYHQGLGGFKSGQYRSEAVVSSNRKQNVYEDLITGKAKIGEDFSKTYNRQNAFCDAMASKQ